MRPNEVVRTVVGSIVVYVIVAACSGASNAPSSHSETAGATSDSSVQGGAQAELTTPATGGPMTGEAGSSGAVPRFTDSPTLLLGGAAGATGAIAQAGRAMNDGGVEGASGVTATGGTRAAATTAAVASAGATGVLDPVPTAKADPISGTRLKAKYREGADGSKEFLNGQWWDSQRGEECYFMATGDGNTRCVPFSASATASGSYFSDSACALELAVAAATAGCNTATSKYLMRWEPPCGGYRFFALAATPHAGVTYTKSGTACIEWSQGAPAGYSFYAIGPEIPLTSFIAGTVKTAD